MIPKIINYCWFGGKPLPETAVKCIQSWKKFCPDYEIKEWNESNFDFAYCDYLQNAFIEKKWGFVSDVARCKIIYENGGIYLDTDVELLRSLDELLSEPAIIGFESPYLINSGNILAAEKNNNSIKLLLEYYTKISLYNEDGSINNTACPVYNTEALKELNLKSDGTLQHLADITVFPKDYFCPKDFYSGALDITENTYSIHHMDGSWLSEAHKKYIYNTRKYYASYPNFIAKLLSKISFINYQFKDKGIIEIIKKILKKLRINLC